VIRSVEIKGLRGIREGNLTDLSPLVILVGPNGSGKSTIIEGILIGASPVTSDAVAEVVLRHEAGGSGPRWLLWRAGETGPTEVVVKTNAGNSKKCRLELDRASAENQTVIKFTVLHNEAVVEGGNLVGVKNKFHSRTAPRFMPLENVPEAHLVSTYPSALQKPLPDLYTKAVQHGRRKDALGIISEVFRDFSKVSAVN